MAVIKHPDQYLIFRHNRWNYHRRVPKKYASVDDRQFVRMTLGTDSLDVARMRRDALVVADDEYWASLAISEADGIAANGTSRQVAEKRYKSASTRAMAHGFAYAPAAVLVETLSVEQIHERAVALKGTAANGGSPRQRDAEALLGGVAAPKDTAKVSKAFKTYLDVIAFDEQYKKSEKQKYSWEKTKRTSVNYFIDVIGDVPMEEITRDMALSYRSWWIERMIPGDDNIKAVKPNTANRHIGNMRKLYEDYFTHIGEEDRPNPFRKMFFKDNSDSQVPSFEDEWVQSKILVPGLFDDLNDELRLMIYVLIETGARISEICNLQPEHIRLDLNIPQIEIRPKDRELKTHTSRREIPLVGVALEAMRQAPNGFPHYRDKGELVSANLMKAFRNRDLFPTTDHVIYSFRHSFEKRMLEAGIDYGLRCTLMGHKNDRPAYGDGGSMDYRRGELMKIAHPVPDGLLARRNHS